MGDSEDIIGGGDPWEYDKCPICGDPIDYCPGHGAEGEDILARRRMLEFLEEWLSGDHHANLTLPEVVARLFDIAKTEEL